MRFLFPVSSMILLACVACGGTTGDVSSVVPPADPNDPTFRAEEVQDPNFRPDYVPSTVSTGPIYRCDWTCSNAGLVNCRGEYATCEVSRTACPGVFGGTCDDGGAVGDTDSGTVTYSDGGAVDADSGYDPTDPGNVDDALCSPGVKRTCEQSLHCCMKVCKTLHSGTTLPGGVVVPGCTSGVHVECAHHCAEAHEECVEERRQASCNK